MAVIAAQGGRPLVGKLCIFILQDRIMWIGWALGREIERGKREREEEMGKERGEGAEESMKLHHWRLWEVL
jgi:hypothetical protein